MPARLADPAQSRPWRSWYSLQWRKRAKHQLQIEPLCALCLERNHVTPATIADHNPPHKGDWNAFRLGPLRSLCRDCHNRQWAIDARGYSCAIADDGLPVDPKHPFNATGAASDVGAQTTKAEITPGLYAVRLRGSRSGDGLCGA